MQGRHVHIHFFFNINVLMFIVRGSSDSNFGGTTLIFCYNVHVSWHAIHQQVFHIHLSWIRNSSSSAFWQLMSPCNHGRSGHERSWKVDSSERMTFLLSSVVQTLWSSSNLSLDPLCFPSVNVFLALQDWSSASWSCFQPFSLFTSSQMPSAILFRLTWWHPTVGKWHLNELLVVFLMGGETFAGLLVCSFFFCIPACRWILPNDQVTWHPSHSCKKIKIK